MDKKNTGKSLRKYYKREVNLFFTHLKNARSTPNENNIHQMRVDIKRLKAIFQLIDMISPKEKFEKNFGQYLGEIFKRAGNIRETQVNKDCLSQFKFPAEIEKTYKEYLRSRQKCFINKFKKTLKKFEPDVLLRSISMVKELSDPIDVKQIKKAGINYIQHEVTRIKELISCLPNDAVIHKIRMRLKSLDAIISLLNKILPSPELEKVLSNLKKYGTSIGDWHDRVVVLISLEKFFIKSEAIAGNKLISFIKHLNGIKSKNDLFYKKMKEGLSPVLRALQVIDLESFPGT